MNREEFEAWEQRISARADRMWEAAGHPEGQRDSFLEEARELLAIEEIGTPTLDPDEAAEPVIEEAAIQGNLGEFPTLRDQGDEQTFPQVPRDTDMYDDGDIRLSDGDASETGGVLPQDDQPEEDLPEVSLADADISASAVNAWDDPPNDDLNDDGLPDILKLDDDQRVDGEMPEEDEYEDAAPPEEDETDDDTDLDDPGPEDDLNP